MRNVTISASPVRLEPGQIAPDFTLPDQNGDPVTLSQLRGGKVILYFYAEAFTPACSAQTCDFRDSFGVFEAAGYRVVGVSRDAVAKLSEFASRNALTFSLLSDPDRAIHDLYGAFGEKLLYGRRVMGVIRSTFVLDETGVIAHALYNIKATGHVAMLRKKLGLAA
jgi:peroxiredoxin Q/BCP